MNKIYDDAVLLTNGTYIEDIHEQDYYEEVYADWSALEDTTFKEEKITEVHIEKVPDSGFRLNGYFIPCYNRQSGCYNDKLKLRISILNKTNNSKLIKNIIDISDCCKFINK